MEPETEESLEPGCPEDALGIVCEGPCGRKGRPEDPGRKIPESKPGGIEDLVTVFLPDPWWFFSGQFQVEAVDGEIPREGVGHQGIRIEGAHTGAQAGVGELDPEPSSHDQVCSEAGERYGLSPSPGSGHRPGQLSGPVRFGLDLDIGTVQYHQVPFPREGPAAGKVP